MRKHQEIMVLDTDNELGDGLFHRTWVHEKCLSHLRQACVIVDEETCSRETAEAKNYLLSLVEQAAQQQTIDMGQSRYLLHRLSSSANGTFRIRPKIHKWPHSLEARPIFNLSGSWVQPAASFLCNCLEKIVPYCHDVITNTDQFIHRLKNHVAFI